MNKLPNEVVNLSTFWLPEGRTIQGAKLFAVSRFWPSRKLGGTSIDDFLASEFKLQQAAVSAGLIKPGAELEPKYTKENLEDRSEKAYTVMAVTVPDENPLGYKVVGMVRPDVAEGGGEAYVKLWFTPIIHPDYQGARAALGKKRKAPLLERLLMHQAIAREQKLIDG